MSGRRQAGFKAKKAVSALLIAALAFASAFCGGPALASRIVYDDSCIDIHSQAAEIRFIMDYTQYINIAVYRNASEAAISGGSTVAPPIGFIAKLYEAQGAQPLAPHPYNPCAIDGSHHAGGSDDELNYRMYTGPVPPFTPVFPFSLPSSAPGEGNAGQEGAADETSEGGAIYPLSGGEGGEDQTAGGGGRADSEEDRAGEGIQAGEEIPAEGGRADGDGQGGEGDQAASGEEGRAGEGDQAGEEIPAEGDRADGDDQAGEENRAGGEGQAGEEEQAGGEAPPAFEAVSGAGGPVITITSVKIIDRDELERRRSDAGEGSFSPLSMPEEFSSPSALEYDPVTGENVLYWDGRYNKNAGTGAAPDWYPVTPASGDDDWVMPIINIEPVGYPWKNVNQSCYAQSDGMGGTYTVHAPGENWEWTNHVNYYARVGALQIDFRGEKVFLVTRPKELSREIKDFLTNYKNGLFGDISLEDLELERRRQSPATIGGGFPLPKRSAAGAIPR